MKSIGGCESDGCENDARYIAIDGKFYCSLCPLELKLDAIRLSDVPRLITASRALVETSRMSVQFRHIAPEPFLETLETILGKKPT